MPKIISRRTLLKTSAAAAAASAIPTRWAIAQAKPVKVGLMLPYSGTFAQLGENITHAIEMYLAEKGGKLGGREIQMVKLDDESSPSSACRTPTADQARQCRCADRHGPFRRADGDPQGRDRVRHAVHRAQRRRVAVTRNLCAKNVFRTSFSNWQPAYGMGVALGKRGIKKAAGSPGTMPPARNPAKDSSRASKPMADRWCRRSR